MLLDRYPGVEGASTSWSAPNGAGDPAARFWSEIATSEAFGPLRKNARRRLRCVPSSEKIVTIGGDMARPRCGIDERIVGELVGSIAWTRSSTWPAWSTSIRPLDEAIAANAFGVQNPVVAPSRVPSAARAPRPGPPAAPRRHGRRASSTRARATSLDGATGPSTRRTHAFHPFPRAGELGAGLWDPEREIAECLDLVAQAEHRADDAFRQSECSADVARRTWLPAANRFTARHMRPSSSASSGGSSPIDSSRAASTGRRTGAGRTSTRTRRRSASRSSREAV